MRHTPIRSLNDISPRRAATTLCALAFLTIAGAWMFQWAGYLPCELCLKQRWAYYIGTPIAAIASTAAWSAHTKILPFLFYLLALIFCASAIFGAYHAGVEWGFWTGPTDCTGTLNRANSMQDFMTALETVKVVRCDAVAIRILGLSLAGWNALISLLLTALALVGARNSTCS
jgi:disulfide bond formation protein DsbB